MFGYIKSITILMIKTAGRRPQPANTMLLASYLAMLQLKRKSFSFQLLKQFYLFPDQSQSSQKTVSKYDSLIFSDEEIHTMFKKLQTKLIERTLWAFLNLKYLRYSQAIAKMEAPLQNLKENTQKQHKTYSFTRIKVYAETKIGNTKFETNTQVEYKRQKKNIKSQQEYQTPKKQRNGGQTFQINIDIKQRTNYRVIDSPRRTGYVPQSPSHTRGSYHVQPRQEQRPTITYPISQIHPLSPAKSTEMVEVRRKRANRLVNGEQDGFRRQERSRSGSIIRYQHDVSGSRKVIVNGIPVPVQIKLLRSQQPLEAPRHTVIRSPKKLQDQRYQPISREELNKRQNLYYQYRNTPNAQRSSIDGRRELTPSRIYGGRGAQNIQNMPLCASCSQKHPSHCPCPVRSGHKIKRLRSNSRNNNAYMQHLNS